MILAAGELDCVAEILVIAAALSAGDPRESPPEGGGPASAAHPPFRRPALRLRGVPQPVAFPERRGPAPALGRPGAGAVRSSSSLRAACASGGTSIASSSSRRGRWACDPRRGPRPTRRSTAPCSRGAWPTSGYGRRGANTAARGSDLRAVTGLVRQAGRRALDRGPRTSWRPRRSSPTWRPAFRPQWIERSARELVTREYFEPHFDPERGEVMALERVVLYGLTVVPRRRVRFAPVDPAGAQHDLHIGGPRERRSRHGGRVRAAQPGDAREDAGDRTTDPAAGSPGRRRSPRPASSKPGFPRKSRANAASGAGMTRRPIRERLCFALGDLVRPGAGLPAAGEFPDEIEVSGVPVPLTYRFAPEDPDDGITARIAPRGARSPRDRAIRMARARPPGREGGGAVEDPARPIRRRIVPLRDTARRCLAWPGLPANGFAAALAAALHEIAGR